MNTEQQDAIHNILKEDEFIALQMMAFVFLLHKKNDKAGIILKTLHQIAPQNHDVRLSLAFVLSEFNLTQEAEDMLAPLIDDEEESSTVINLLRTKIMLAQKRSDTPELEVINQ